MFLSNIKFILTNVIFLPIHILKGNKISFQSKCSFSSKLISTSVDRYSYIGPNCIINFASISSFSSIAPNCVIGGLEHSISSPAMSVSLYAPQVRRETYIEHDVWVGANCFIRQGVTLGIGCVIAAGSVVLDDVPPFSIVGGVPARFIKFRNIFSDIDPSAAKHCFSLKTKNDIRSCLTDLLN